MISLHVNLAWARNVQPRCCHLDALRWNRPIPRRWMSGTSDKSSAASPMSSAEQLRLKQQQQQQHEDAIREANRKMKGYVETRILAKQGKLRSKRGGSSSKTTQSQNAMQLSMLVSLTLAFIAAPILGKKIATDDEFREKYIPSWYDFRVKRPESAWTRQELHEQLVQVEMDMRERAIRGEFTPQKLEELKKSMQPRSDLSEEDLHYAKKYGWGKIHPGVDDEDYDDDEE